MRRFGWMLVWMAALTPFASADEELKAQAVEAMQRATDYFVDNVAVEGSYLWWYSPDLTVRWGEGEATATQGWVQPSGTPVIGDAYLRAYEATRDERYMRAAAQVAHALVSTQLISGGWDYRIEFDPAERGRWAYRADAGDDPNYAKDRRNTTTYDDDNTQSALTFLMRYDEATHRGDAAVHKAVVYGLDMLLKSQYPNGAFPQRYAGETWSKEEYPVLKAHYPDTWEREYSGKDYRHYYTFNDNAMRDTMRVFIAAHRQYGDERYRDAAMRVGDFMLLAQMPEPQPAWAQQYNHRMEPDWARQFEPPSIVSSESVGVIRALVELYQYTGEKKYLDATVPAVEWLNRSSISDGRWARFYELTTNAPLYFTTDYQLVYTDDDLPTHYSFQSSYGVAGATALVNRVVREGAESRDEMATGQLGQLVERQESRAREAIDALDDQGRWVDGDRITTRDFAQNLNALADYVMLFEEGMPSPE